MALPRVNRVNAHTGLLFKKFGILKFDDMISFHNISLVYDFLMRKLPESFSNFFTKTSQVHTIVTRNSNCTIWVPSVKSVKYGMYSINRRSIDEWNAFIGTTRINPYFISKLQIKKTLKSHFMANY